jgi:glycosyltransferase involved in cell wall biosynthesis
VTPRRILMTTDAVGGVWTHALELARGLAAEGGELLLAVLGLAPDAGQEAEAAAIPGLHLVVTGLDLEWRDRAGPLLPEARHRLLTLEQAFKPDLIHVNGFREAASGFKAPVVAAAHSCVGTWWRACRQEALPAAWEPYAQGVRAGLRAADAVATPTAAFLAAFAAVWGPLPRPRAIPNGLDLDPPAARRRPVILAAGRLWDEAKNIQALVQVAPRLPWPVLLAGEPPQGGLGDAVSCLGRLAPAELHALMAEAAIFAAPARYEPFGLAVLEAARAGCALVLGRTPSLIELWGDAARFVPPDDHDALAGTLLDLIHNDALRLRLQRAARERAQAFSRRRMVEGYQALYAELPAKGTTVKDRAA